MTDTFFWVLYAIVHSEEPMTQNDLCSDFFFPLQTIHSAINNLRKDRLLKMQVIPRTRNHKAILLTEKGKTFAANKINKAYEIEKMRFCASMKMKKNGNYIFHFLSCILNT